MEAQEEEQEQEDDDGGDEGAGAKVTSLPKNKELVFMNLACTTLWGVPYVKYFQWQGNPKHIATCQELPQPRRQKEFLFPKEDCVKKYVDQKALDHHVADHEGRIIHPVCQYCGKQLSTQYALNLYIDTACPDKPVLPKKRKKSKKAKQT